MLRIAYTPDGGYDLVNDHGLQTDEGLESAVVYSLFTDAPATDDELQFYGFTREQNRGWWGNSYAEIDGDVLGSKLWLLARAKRTDASLADGKAFAAQAVAWMITDGHAAKIPITASWYRSTGFLVVGAEMYQPGDLKPRWRRAWNATTGQSLE